MNSVHDPRMAYKSARSALLSAGNAYGISIGQPIESVLVTIPDSLEVEIGNCDGGECNFASDHTYLSQESRDDGERSFASYHTYLDQENRKENMGWEHAEVLLLISSYQQHQLDFHDRKKKRKDIWQKISDDMATHGHLRTAADCETKFKGLKRTYNKHRQHKRKSGRDRKGWPFYKEMDDLLSSSAEYRAPVLSSHAGQPSTSSAQVLPASSPCSAQIHSTESTRFIEEDSVGDLPQERCVLNARAAKQRRRPITVLQNIFENMQAWQDEERQRYRQQLKMQRAKLRMLKRLTESLG
ncbi:uncharacterized protein LOC115326511 isoform X2 [Ixodes scapularis]|nr:uncharacterized protein LOC115326511 isoform X2 [Ixodes scapularis]